VVLDGQGRFLAIRRRDTGAWQLPGGVLELDERIEQGVRREVLEETGVLVEPERLTGVYKHTGRGIVALVFRCRRVGGVERTSDESSAVTWLTDEQVRELVEPVFAVRMLDAVAGPWPHVRDHDGVRLLD
jgi:8-oxo-dGTP diphosphatase